MKFAAGGAATVNATVSGKLSAPRLAGDVLATNFSAEGRPFTRLATNFEAARTGASVSNGVLARGALQATFAAAVGLRDWKPENTAPLTRRSSPSAMPTYRMYSRSPDNPPPCPSPAP